MTDGVVRNALLVAHSDRRDSLAYVVSQLTDAGMTVRVLTEESGGLRADAQRVSAGPEAAASSDIVIALGGDGTLLRAAELARPVGAPLLGVNLGRVGFLAEAEVDDLDQVLRQVVTNQYSVDERLTVDLEICRNGETVARDWALNEVSVEKVERARMLDVMVCVDGHPLSRWGCDGVVCATPTGSTAYAFSAGGPVVWPEVEALLLVPISAHALFSRPLVTAPTSTITIDLLTSSRSDGVVWCDGRRTHRLRLGDHVRVRRAETPVRVVRLHPRAFTDRLVAKFALPVDGWRAPE